jgi:hypothetical protein
MSGAQHIFDQNPLVRGPRPQRQQASALSPRVKRNAQRNYLTVRHLAKRPYDELSQVCPRKVTDHNAEMTEFFT